MPKKTSNKTKVNISKTSRASRARGGALSYRVRRSAVHGTGLFATRTIEKGEKIIEYVGQRISHAEADRRHAKKAHDDNHTFLFTIDSKTVIDAGVDGNDARFINHSCDPNCEVILEDGRPMIEALRTIAPSEELAYDYNLTREDGDSPEVEKIFACRCGAKACRGTMLANKKTKAKAKNAKAKALAQAKIAKAKAKLAEAKAQAQAKIAKAKVRLAEAKANRKPKAKVTEAKANGKPKSKRLRYARPT